MITFCFCFESEDKTESDKKEEGDSVDGEYVDGEYVDGEYVDGEYVDGVNVDGEFVGCILGILVGFVVGSFDGIIHCLLIHNSLDSQHNKLPHGDDGHLQQI